MKILLTGDIHLGRSSSRVRGAVSSDNLRSAAAWDRIVGFALRETVALVCLSGDVADQSNKFFEAIGPLQRGVQKLAEAGILTVAVAGNHDYDVLARLADQLPSDHFRLLGRNGEWERFTFTQAGRSILHLDGWSFPSQYVRTSPLDTYKIPPDPAVPVLGVVHGDLDDAGSRYAPLDLARLQALPVSGWLLGHIHVGNLFRSDGGPWVLYPGSPQALDPGENGPHGLWIVNLDGSSLSLPEQRQISSVWYERLDVDLTNAGDEEAVESRLLTRVRQRAEEIVQTAGPDLAHISFRLRLQGATCLSHAVALLAERIVQDLSLVIHETIVTVESCQVATVPAIDLDEYAGMHSAPGALARLLRDLEAAEPPPDVAELIRRAQRDLEMVEGHRDFSQLERRELTEALARRHLQEQARALLAQLMTQAA